MARADKVFHSGISKRRAGGHTGAILSPMPEYLSPGVYIEEVGTFLRRFGTIAAWVTLGVIVGLLVNRRLARKRELAGRDERLDEASTEQEP